MSILATIIAEKQLEIQRKSESRPLAELERELGQRNRKTRNLVAALRQNKSYLPIIAEIKRKSPSRGVLRKLFDPLAIAQAYTANGAAALSILTDYVFFEGQLDYIKLVKSAISLPILRKDFMIDPYQIVESAVAGADAVLLIAAVLAEDELRALMNKSLELNLSVLFEIHTKTELEKILNLSPNAKNCLIGINNRDLQSFAVDIQHTIKLIKHVPKDYIVVSESGIQTHEHLTELKKKGVGAVLVGESLMTQNDPGEGLARLLRKS